MVAVAAVVGATVAEGVAAGFVVVVGVAVVEVVAGVVVGPAGVGGLVGALVEAGLVGVAVVVGEHDSSWVAAVVGARTVAEGVVGPSGVRWGSCSFDLACCDASASGPGGVVGCAFGVAVAEAFDRVPSAAAVVVVGLGVAVVGVAVVESVAVFASSAAVEIAGVEGGAEWEERLAVAVRGLGTAPG